ncbi:hypothetical protein BKA82DRAFT_4014998 [Pisolithus tinctorius]|nr:hypothetical protein BKA82DRAFT_4014998 [Pisolithus tinctorius]
MASSNHSTNCVNTSDEEDFSSNEESSLDSMETAIKNWMYNNSQSQAQKALVKYGSKWMALKVIKLQHKKDIQQVLVKAGIQPRMSAMIKHYQPAIQKVVQSLTKAELDQAAHLVKEWNKRKPPPEAQADFALSALVKFSSVSYTGHKGLSKVDIKTNTNLKAGPKKQCGMRVVIMLAWKDKDGKVMVGVDIFFSLLHWAQVSYTGHKAFRNDFNDKLGDGELYSDWEDLHGKWSAYTKKAFWANGTEDGSREDEASQTTVKAWKGKKQSQFSLSTNDDGTPVLPNLLDLQTPELKDIMRVFITGHYHTCQFPWLMSLACGKTNASVPWAAIADNWASYMSSKYLPPNIPFKEPTRLTHHVSYLVPNCSTAYEHHELIKTLEFWKEQQQEHPEDVFQFQRWRSQDGSLEEPVSKHQCQSDKAKGKRPWTEVDGSNYRHHSEEEPAPPTKPSTKQQWIDDHPTGTSNAQEDNRWQNQSTSDWHNMTTAYPKPADNHANDGVDSTAKKPKPKPRIRSNAAQNDKMVISPNDGVDPVGRNLNARPRGHVMDRDDRLLDQVEEDGVACCPEWNCRPPQQPDDNYPTPTMRRQR